MQGADYVWDPCISTTGDGMLLRPCGHARPERSETPGVGVLSDPPRRQRLFLLLPRMVTGQLNLHLPAILLAVKRKERLRNQKGVGSRSRSVVSLRHLLPQSLLFTHYVPFMIQAHVVAVMIAIVVGYRSWLAIGRLKRTM